MLPFLQAIVGEMISLVAVVAILAGIIKVFQIATSLNEIKDLLTEIKRNTQDYSTVAGTSRSRTPERALGIVGTTSEADSIIRASLLDS